MEDTELSQVCSPHNNEGYDGEWTENERQTIGEADIAYQSQHNPKSNLSDKREKQSKPNALTFATISQATAVLDDNRFQLTDFEEK